MCKWKIYYYKHLYPRAYPKQSAKIDYIHSNLGKKIVKSQYSTDQIKYNEIKKSMNKTNH